MTTVRWIKTSMSFTFNKGVSVSMCEVKKFRRRKNVNSLMTTVYKDVDTLHEEEELDEDVTYNTTIYIFKSNLKNIELA